MAADDALGVASEIPLRMFRRLIAPPQHEQANLVFHSREGFVEVSIALAVTGLRAGCSSVRGLAKVAAATSTTVPTCPD